MGNAPSSAVVGGTGVARRRRPPSKLKAVGKWVATGPKRALQGTKAASKRRSTWSLKLWTTIGALKAGAYSIARDVRAIRMLTDHAIPSLVLPKGVRIMKKVELVPGGATGPSIRAEIYSKKGTATTAAIAQQVPTVLYFHGGAYCTCSSATHRRLLSDLCLRTGARIIAIDYRRPPEHPFPVPRNDGVRAYRHLVENMGVDASSIILAGDSSGGGLAMSVLIHMSKMEGETRVPMPAGAILLSLSLGGP